MKKSCWSKRTGHMEGMGVGPYRRNRVQPSLIEILADIDGTITPPSTPPPGRRRVAPAQMTRHQREAFDRHIIFSQRRGREPMTERQWLGVYGSGIYKGGGDIGPRADPALFEFERADREVGEAEVNADIRNQIEQAYTEFYNTPVVDDATIDNLYDNLLGLYSALWNPTQNEEALLDELGDEYYTKERLKRDYDADKKRKIEQADTEYNNIPAEELEDIDTQIYHYKLLILLRQLIKPNDNERARLRELENI